MTGSATLLPMARLFRRRLLVAGFAVVLVSAALLLAQLMHLQRQALTRNLAVTAELSADQIGEFMRSREAAVATIAAITPPDADWPWVLGEARKRFEDFLTMLVVDAGGIVLAGVPDVRDDGTVFPWAGSDVRDRPYYREALERRRSHVSGVFQGRGFGTDPIVAVSAPVLDADGTPVRVVQGTIGSRAFADLRAVALRKRDLSLLVLDGGHQVIYASPDLRFKALDPIEGPLANGGLARLAGAYRNGDDAHYGIATTHAGWDVLVLQPVGMYTAALRRQAVNVLLPAVLALLVVVVSASLLARNLSRPISRLAEEMRSFAFLTEPEGREMVPGQSSEVHALGEAFHELVERLGKAYAQTQAALEAQRELHGRLQAALESQDRVIRERTEELRHANERLQTLSVTDELTGALNYRGFREVANALWKDVGEGSLAAIACDIDHFKAFNDLYGHPAGDACLKRVAAAMRSALLRPEDPLCRVGGEEFVALVPGLGLAEARAVAERMRSAVIQLSIPHQASPTGVVTVSLGIAVVQGSGDGDPTALLKAADQALYRAKQSGRDRVSE